MNIKSLSTLKKFENILRFKNYSDNTIKLYICYAKLFLNDFDKDIYHIPIKDVEEYLINKSFKSISQQNQYISSIKLLYQYIIKCKLKINNIQRPISEKKLPLVIDNDTILNKINNIKNLKHKSILLLSYSVGLRISEIINLKISDIDSNRMIINIKQSKGKKDRIVPLSINVLKKLRLYYISYKPIEYLFNGQKSLKYSTSSCNKIVKNYLGEQYHFHTLRHSCFTNLLENGTDIKIIKELAGHNDIKTTEKYLHLKSFKNLELLI